MRKMIVPAIAAGLMFLLGACSTAETLVSKAAPIAATVAMNDPEQAEFIMADLAEARRTAEAYNDTIALQCYDYLLVKLPELGVRGTTDVKGAISAFQKTRNGVKMGQEGLSDEFYMACGPLYMDAKKDVKGVIGFVASLASPL